LDLLSKLQNVGSTVVMVSPTHSEVSIQNHAIPSLERWPVGTSRLKVVHRNLHECFSYRDHRNFDSSVRRRSDQRMGRFVNIPIPVLTKKQGKKESRV